MLLFDTSILLFYLPSLLPLILTEAQSQIMQEIYSTQSNQISPPFPAALCNQYHIAEFLFSKVYGFYWQELSLNLPLQAF